MGRSAARAKVPAPLPEGARSGFAVAQPQSSGMLVVEHARIETGLAREYLAVFDQFQAMRADMGDACALQAAPLHLFDQAEPFVLTEGLALQFVHQQDRIGRLGVHLLGDRAPVRKGVLERALADYLHPQMRRLPLEADDKGNALGVGHGITPGLFRCPWLSPWAPRWVRSA